MIADSAVELEQYRLLVLKAAWLIDEVEAGRLLHNGARQHIGMAKVAMARVYHEIVRRAVHLHSALGTTHETPLVKMWMGVPMLAIADGPTEVHQVQIANRLLKATEPASGLFPSEHIPTKLEAVKQQYGERL